MQWQTDDPVLCPIIQWANIVSQIWGYQGTTPSTPVSTFSLHGKLIHLMSKDIKTALHNGVVGFGEAKLRIDRTEIGRHSIRSSATMAMYLGGIPIFAWPL